MFYKMELVVYYSWLRSRQPALFGCIIVNNRGVTEIHKVSLGGSSGKHGGQGAPAANQARQQAGCKQRERPCRGSATEGGESRRRRQKHRDSARVRMNLGGETSGPTPGQ